MKGSEEQLHAPLFHACEHWTSSSQEISKILHFDSADSLPTHTRQSVYEQYISPNPRCYVDK